MSSVVKRWVSPDGERVALADRSDGSVWLMRRLGPGEAAEVMTLIPAWNLAADDDDDDSDAPEDPPRKRSRRSRKRPALTLIM